MNQTLAEAKDWLRERVDMGACCPLCTQHAKVYRRSINAGMALLMLKMYGAAEPGQWVNVPSLGGQGGDVLKARYWGLIEQMPDAVRGDGSPRTGWWRLTHEGERFVRNESTVPKYARVFNNRALNLVDGESISIIDALGKRFDYRELMAGL